MHRITRDLRPEDYSKAVEYATSGGNLKTADLQRHFGDIGYNAAAYLMERMVSDGVVSECDSLGRRTLLAEDGQ